MTDFLLSNNVGYVAFQVHSVLTDVNCLSASQMFAVLEENLPEYLIIPRST